MTSHELESQDPPHSPTPLDYVDTNNPKLEQDLPHEPDGNPGNDHGGPMVPMVTLTLVTLMIMMMMTPPLMIPTLFLHQLTIAQKVTDSL